MSASAPRVLWTEPSAADRELIQAALKDLRVAVKVEFLPDCRSLLQKVKRAPPKLVVLDFGISADECTTEVHALGQVVPLAPVVVFTGYEGRPEREALLRQGAVDVIQKPTSFEEFREAVRCAVSHVAA